MNATRHTFTLIVKAARLLAVMCLWLAVAGGLYAQEASPQKQLQQPIEGVGIIEKLGADIPLDLAFTDESGKSVKLRDYFAQGKPVVLNLAYYRCPGTCSAVISGLTGALQQLPDAPGASYQIVTLSFDPREKADLAAGKRDNYLQMLNRPGAESGWHFLTGGAANIKAITEAVGFGYKWNEETQQFAHDMGIVILSGQGRISRYLRGAFYEPQTLRLSLVEAGNGKIGTMSERLWTSLCGYDPAQGKYVMYAGTIMRIGGALTVGALAAVLGFYWLREIKRRKVTAIHGHVRPA